MCSVFWIIVSLFSGVRVVSSEALCVVFSGLLLVFLHQVCLYFHDYSIGFWNCFDDVIFLVFRLFFSTCLNI